MSTDQTTTTDFVDDSKCEHCGGLMDEGAYINGDDVCSDCRTPLPTEPAPSALVCAEVAAGRELRDGATVRRGGERVLLAASVARRLAHDGAVVVLDEEQDGCRGQPL